MTRRTLTWLLAASLAVNLFLAGFLAARSLRHHDVERRRPPDLFHIGGALRGSDVPGVRQKMRTHMQQARPARRELRRARAEVKAALEAEQFDRQRLESALAELRAQSVKMQDLLHGALVDVVDGLSAQERRSLAEANWSGRRRGPKVGPPAQK